MLQPWRWSSPTCRASNAWRDKAPAIDRGQLSLTPIALVAAACLQLILPVTEGRNVVVALGALALAGLPALAAWHRWRARNTGPPKLLRRDQLGLRHCNACRIAGPSGLVAPLTTAIWAVGAFLCRADAANPCRSLRWSAAPAFHGLAVDGGSTSRLGSDDRGIGSNMLRWLPRPGPWSSSSRNLTSALLPLAEIKRRSPAEGLRRPPRAIREYVRGDLHDQLEGGG